MKRLETTPKMDGYRMPGEFEPHAGCYMIWPERPDNWRLGGKPAQDVFARVANTIGLYEPMTMIVSKAQFANARHMLRDYVRVVEMSNDDSWVRDCGATFVKDDKGGLRGVDWTFNAWGGLVDGLYFPWDSDDKIAQKMCELERVDSYRTDGFVLEGGSIHVDGEGTVMVTEECLLSAGRNPHMTKEEIGAKLCEYLNCEKVLWIPRGIYNDETNAHVDNMANFVRPGVIVLSWTDDVNDPQYERSVEAYNYLSNETGSIVAFVHSGSLYEYNQNTGRLIRIFGFRGEDLIDPRTNYDEHNILILNIDESGTLDFVVYGYMNAGNHEGESGINLYHYDSVKDVATEQVFIPSTNSYQILNARFSNLLYLNTNHIFYIMVDGTLLQVNLDTLSTKEVVSSLSDNQYASSKSSRYFAWMDEENITHTLHIMDLETGNTFDINGGDEYLKPVDFIDEDLILGYVRTSDVSTDAAGVEIYPMHKLSICKVTDGKSESIKDYEKNGYYILSARKENTALILNRIKKMIRNI